MGGDGDFRMTRDQFEASLWSISNTYWEPEADIAACLQEYDRLRAVEAAAREYAASRRAWDAMLPVATESGVPVGEWDACQRRQDAARVALLALFTEGEQG